SRPADELIIVDQSSDRRGHDAVNHLFEQHAVLGKPVPRLEYILNTTVLGAAAARNLGIDCSNGEVLVFLDDDVLLERPFLEEVLVVYDQDPSIGGVSGIITNYARPRFRDRSLRRLFWRGSFHDERQPIYWNAGRLLEQKPMPVSRFGTTGMSVRRRALDGERFDPTL